MAVGVTSLQVRILAGPIGMFLPLWDRLRLLFAKYQVCNQSQSLLFSTMGKLWQIQYTSENTGNLPLMTYISSLTFRPCTWLKTFALVQKIKLTWHWNFIASFISSKSDKGREGYDNSRSLQFVSHSLHYLYFSSVLFHCGNTTTCIYALSF